MSALALVHAATVTTPGAAGPTNHPVYLAADQFYWSWIGRNSDLVWLTLRQHVDLTVRAVLIGLVISLPVSVLIRSVGWLKTGVLGVAGVLYTIPGVAAIFLLGPFTGYLSRLTIDIILISYTLLILIRNIVTGLDEVPADVLEAGRGMGLSRWQLLVKVELPLALPAIMAGLRIATVTTIGLATFAAFVGQGGLGFLIINRGIDRDIPSAAVVGSLLAVGLAIVAEVILVTVQKALSPWARVRRGPVAVEPDDAALQAPEQTVEATLASAPVRRAAGETS